MARKANPLDIRAKHVIISKRDGYKDARTHNAERDIRIMLKGGRYNNKAGMNFDSLGREFEAFLLAMPTSIGFDTKLKNIQIATGVFGRVDSETTNSKEMIRVGFDAALRFLGRQFLSDRDQLQDMYSCETGELIEADLFLNGLVEAVTEELDILALRSKLVDAVMKYAPKKATGKKILKNLDANFGQQQLGYRFTWLAFKLAKYDDTVSAVTEHSMTTVGLDLSVTALRNAAEFIVEYFESINVIKVGSRKKVGKQWRSPIGFDPSFMLELEGNISDAIARSNRGEVLLFQPDPISECGSVYRESGHKAGSAKIVKSKVDMGGAGSRATRALNHAQNTELNVNSDVLELMQYIYKEEGKYE